MKYLTILIVICALAVGVRSDIAYSGTECYDIDPSCSACYSGCCDWCYDHCQQEDYGWSWGNDNSGRYGIKRRNCGWWKYTYYFCHVSCANCTAGTNTSCSRCNPGYYRGIFTGQTTTCYAAGSCPTGSVDLPNLIVCTACDTPCY